MAIKFLNTATGITEAAGDNSTKIATTAYVDAAAAAVPIGDYVTLATTQTISGAKTFSASQTIFDGNVGIGTTSPQSKLTVNGDARLANSGKLYLWNDHSINYLDYRTWVASSSAGMTIRNSAAGGNILLIPNGNVGIGTSSPGYKLDVTGQGFFTSGIITNTAVAVKLKQAAGTLNDATEFRVGGGEFKMYSGRDSGVHQAFVFATGDNYTSGSERMRITSSGNVGIGTTSPTTPLHVAGIIQIIESGNTAFYGGNYVRTFGDQSYSFRNTGGYIRGIINTTSGNFSLYNSSSVLVNQIATAGNSYFNGGNVGIGTTSPGEKLSVSGNIELDDMPANGARWLLTNETNTGTGRLSIQAGGGSSAYGGGLNLFANAHATKPGWVTAGISAGSGTAGTASEGRFTVNNQGVGGGTDIFTVLRTGNVGIGTTSPGYKLDVNGNIRGTGTSQLGHLGCISTLSFGAFTTGTKGTQFEGYSTHSVVRTDSARLDFYMGKTTTGVGTMMSLTDTGRVGIGVTNPSARLHVDGTVKFSSSGDRIFIADGSFGTFELGDIDGVSDEAKIVGNGSNIIISNTGTETLTCSGNNRVGIGTISPQSKLDVSGGDIEVKDIASGVIMKSPNGTRYRVTIANGGTLVVTAV